MSSCGTGGREGVTDSCDSWIGHMPSSNIKFQNLVSTKVILSSFTQINDSVACDSTLQTLTTHGYSMYWQNKNFI